MNEPILPLLLALGVALLLLGCAGGLLPKPLAGAATSLFGGTAAVLCAIALVGQGDPAELLLPFTVPTLSVRFGLDAVNAVFLLGIMICGTAVAAGATISGRAPTLFAATALTMAGLMLTLLAAGAVPLTIGLAITWAGLWRQDPAVRPPPLLLAALLMLLALGLSAPSGSAPDFAAIRAYPPDGIRLEAAAVLGLAGAAAMLLPSPRGVPVAAALTAGGVMPAALYLLTRLLVDLPGPAAETWWGITLMLGGGAAAVVLGWQAAGHPDLDGSFNALVRQQVVVAVLSLGVCITGRAADLPEASTLALAATVLLALGASVAGTLGCVSIAALTESAGTARLARLGGLMQTMPIASAGLATSLLAFAAVPPGLGFAGLWLAFHALLSGPRTGGLLAQGPTALAAAALAASAALATAASVRVAGIALLGRPRSARASAARDVRRVERPVLIILGGLVTLIGVLPGATLNVLALQAVRGVTGGSGPAGWLTLSASPAATGYSALPTLALLLLATGGIWLLTQRYRAGSRRSTVWNGGQAAAPNLPFGEPMAQSAGTGFRPALPDLPRAAPSLPSPRAVWRQAVSGRAGLWAILASIGLLLLLTTLHPASGP